MNIKLIQSNIIRKTIEHLLILRNSNSIKVTLEEIKKERDVYMEKPLNENNKILK
jgi:hypothetical protein